MEPRADQLRQQIEHTHADVERDVDELQEALQPGNVLSRGMESVRESVKDRFGQGAEAVKGAMTSKVRSGTETMDENMQHLRDSASEGMHRRSSQVGRTVGSMASSPAGVATFGLAAVAAGWGLSRALPQGRLDEDLRRIIPADSQESLSGAATQTAGELAEHMKEPAREAALGVKQDVTAAVTRES